MITLKNSYGVIRIPLEHGTYEIHGRHEYKIIDDYPEPDSGRVIEITHEVDNVTDEGMIRQYWRVFAIVDGDDIELVAVEEPVEEEF